MSGLPCVITYPLSEGLELLQKQSYLQIELVYIKPPKTELIGGEERIVAQRVDEIGKIILLVAHEQIAN